MSLNCSLSLSRLTTTAGQTPPVMATLTVFNPNAVAVVVTGIQITGNPVGNTTQALPIAPISPPIGMGQTVSVPASSSINIGPFAIVVDSAANANQFQMAQQSSQFNNPTNPQLAMPATYSAQINALVQASDGSINVAVPAVLLVNASSQPPVGYQGQGRYDASAVGNISLMGLGFL